MSLSFEAKIIKVQIVLYYRSLLEPLELRISINGYWDVWTNWKPLVKFGVGAAVLSIIFGVTSIAGVVALYDSINQREILWNKVFDEKLVQLDTTLKSFVDICGANPEIKEDCAPTFSEIWNSTCNRELDWDKIDSCKRIQGFLLRS